MEEGHVVIPPPDQPSWKDLAEFTARQAENDRRVIEFWFKLAAALLGFVLASAVAIIGFVGWKTIADAKATAEAAAHEAAKAKVEEILQKREIRDLVERTAMDLIAKGEFRKATEDAVRAELPALTQAEIRKQLPRQITTELRRLDLEPRTISDSLEREFAPKLRPFRSDKYVRIRYSASAETTSFALRLAKVLTDSGLKVDAMSEGGLIVGTDLMSPVRELTSVLTELFKRATGRTPKAKTVRIGRQEGSKEDQVIEDVQDSTGKTISIFSSVWEKDLLAYLRLGEKEAQEAVR